MSDNTKFRVGFSNLFPPKEGSKTDARTYRIYVPQYYQYVDVEVCKAWLVLDIEKGWGFDGIEATGGKLKLAAWQSFGSHSYREEGQAMLEAAEKYADEMGLEIGQVFNNWPEFRASVRKKD